MDTSYDIEASIVLITCVLITKNKGIEWLVLNFDEFHSSGIVIFDQTSSIRLEHFTKL